MSYYESSAAAGQRQLKRSASSRACSQRINSMKTASGDVRTQVQHLSAWPSMSNHGSSAATWQRQLQRTSSNRVCSQKKMNNTKSTRREIRTRAQYLPALPPTSNHASSSAAWQRQLQKTASNHACLQRINTMKITSGEIRTQAQHLPALPSMSDHASSAPAWHQPRVPSFFAE